MKKSTTLLTFFVISILCVSTVQAQKLKTGWYHISMEDSTGIKRTIQETGDTYFINPTPILTASDIATISCSWEESQPDYTGQGIYAISMMAAENKKQTWQDATRAAIGKNVGFVLDDELLSSPRVNAEISGGGSQIVGRDIKQMQRYMKVLKKEIGKR